MWWRQRPILPMHRKVSFYGRHFRWRCDGRSDKVASAEGIQTRPQNVGIPAAPIGFFFVLWIYWFATKALILSSATVTRNQLRSPLHLKCLYTTCAWWNVSPLVKKPSDNKISRLKAPKNATIFQKRSRVTPGQTTLSLKTRLCRKEHFGAR